MSSSQPTSFGRFCVFSPYVACEGVLLFCRGPSFSQPIYEDSKHVHSGNVAAHSSLYSISKSVLSICMMSFSQRRRKDNINKISVLEGVRRGKSEGNLSNNDFCWESQDAFDHNKAKNCFFQFPPVDFFLFSPGFLCNLVRSWPQDVEKIARFLGGEKSVESCHVSGCHGFFRESP